MLFFIRGGEVNLSSSLKSFLLCNKKILQIKNKSHFVLLVQVAFQEQSTLWLTVVHQAAIGLLLPAVTNRGNTPTTCLDGEKTHLLLVFFHPAATRGSNETILHCKTNLNWIFSPALRAYGVAMEPTHIVAVVML